jgi:hypothetical protein
VSTEDRASQGFLDRLMRVTKIVMTRVELSGTLFLVAVIEVLLTGPHRRRPADRGVCFSPDRTRAKETALGLLLPIAYLNVLNSRSVKEQAGWSCRDSYLPSSTHYLQAGVSHRAPALFSPSCLEPSSAPKAAHGYRVLHSAAILLSAFE